MEVEDLIKRSDAIKAVSKVDDYGDGIGFEVRSHCLVELELVPSADRPNEVIYGNEHNCIMTIFGECSYAETGCGDCAVANKVRKVLSADRPQGWIPCSERLPEKKAQKYLIYYQDYLNGGFDYAVVPYLRTPYGWEFEFYNESNNCETLAWMPLPEPWKGADDESN